MSPRKKTIRRLLWIYFWLVILEGALRKWILPQLATPLLVARDPICVALLLVGMPCLVKQAWAWGFVAIGAIAVPIAVVVGHGNLFVALFGARILILHFPLIFLFPAVFDRDDVWKFARATLLISIPMTVLLAFQFYVPESHIVNIGVGGEGASVFSGAAGRHRSSGTFSFTNGVAAFYSMAGALFIAWLVRGPRPLAKWFFAAGGCLAVAMPLAISRAIAFQYAITGMFGFLAIGMSPKLLRNVVPAGLGMAIIVLGASQLSLFQTAMEAFGSRWEAATRGEGKGDGVAGVIQHRILEYSILSAFRSIDKIPLMGLGIGLGTNVGAKLQTGERGFLVAEAGLGAIIGELGPVMGLGLIMYRAAFACLMAAMALKASKLGNPMPLIIGSVAIHNMLIGNASQPTELGFLVLNCGFMIAAMKKPPRRRHTQKKTDPPVSVSL